MNYTIQSKSDLAAGAMLVVTFPQEELDLKALATIQADQPQFLVPFRHRCIDGRWSAPTSWVPAVSCSIASAVGVPGTM